MMRIAILGAHGQLGRDLVEVLSQQEILPYTRQDFDVTDHVRVREVLTAARPDIIVNTTAFHRVDDCESKADTAYGVNALAVLNLVRIANDLGSTLVHFSTDYVFDGAADQPYTESSETLPLSVYGNSKLAGELLVRTLSRRYFLIRTCGLYGRAGSGGKGGNFVTTMLKKARSGDAIRVVRDQVLTPTATRDLARQVALLLPTEHYGLFHITAEGACSWYEFAQAIFDLASVNADLSPTTSEAYKTPAVRPAYSVLENRRLKDLGLNTMLHWRPALAEYLAARTDLLE